MSVIRAIGIVGVLLPLLQATGAEPASDSAWPIVVAPSAYAVDLDASGRGDCLTYRVKSPYPGTEVRQFVSSELRKKGFSVLQFDFFRTTRVPLTSGWERWGSIQRKTEQWQNARGDIIEYRFEYVGQAEEMEINACFLTVEELANMVHYRNCPTGAAIPADRKAYSAAIQITKLEPAWQKSYRVFVTIQNSGTKPILLIADQLPDGTPWLRGLAVEQQEQGEWGYVGGAMAEYPPREWITLKPGEKLESWAPAVDLPAPNSRVGMVIRKIAHLHGNIRASIGYYTSACAIQGGRGGFSATSEPVALPANH